MQLKGGYGWNKKSATKWRRTASVGRRKRGGGTRKKRQTKRRRHK